ncbi:flagellar biosynthetic protein FliO [Motiliproteus sediminis]|uniref:flagellar biosynthetic protein FliO n=1 Tax=Motiliproteus sediminis TaxID=1468178 RepID=UPI001AEF790B|nr:flagellar biosynthetic protein FliO [Motiliproteus sediminis]
MRQHLLPALLLLLPVASQAATSGAASSVSPVSSGSIIQVLLALLLVVAAIFVLAWLMRRMQAGAGFATKGMKVVAMLPLSTRERVVLVDIGGQQLLLGVAPGRVSLLQRFDEPVLDTASPGGGEFRERLKQALRSGSGRG